MQIWRCFLCKDVENLIRAFTTYVVLRPVLEYCSPVWSPVSVSLINQLESVQRRFTKRLPGLRSLTYDERCARLGINRLELRRLHADLTLCYKIIHGLVLLSCDRFLTIVYDHTTWTRGHSLKLFVPSSRVNCRQHFFAVRVIDVWNSLPDDVVSANESPLYIRRRKLSIEYCLKLSSCTRNPTYGSVFESKFKRFFDRKPNRIPPLGIRVEPCRFASS